MICGKRVLLTGGAGFIGTTLCERLADNNEILIYDNLRRNALYGTSLATHPRISIIEGDILDANRLTSVVGDFQPEFVIHLAAVAGIDTVIKSPTTTMKVNMVGTYNLLESLRGHESEIERLLFFSTSEVFGTYAYKVAEHHDTNLAPVGEARWTYSVSKLAGEHLVFSYYKEFGLRVACVRPFNVYGPGQVGEGAVHVFIKRALVGDDLEIHGDGDQIRSWCYISDMVEGALLAMEHPQGIGQVFNIGNPRGTITIRSLAEKIVSLTGSSSRIVHVPKNYVDVELRIPSIDKAKQVLGFEPKVDLEDGLKKTITWYGSKVREAM